MVRLKDIAEKANVSVMTVSKALRDEPDVSAATKARIRALAQQLGYVPDSNAQNLRTRKTKLFGLAVSSMTNPIFSRVVLAVEECAREHGYDMILGHTLNKPEQEEACLRSFLARGVDGIFVSPVYRLGTDSGIYQEITKRAVPTVVLGHPAPFCNQFVNVESDDSQASYQITQHLLKLGHKRIAFLGGPPATPWTEERFDGYRRALREAGIEHDDKLVFQAGRLIEDGAKAAAQMVGESCDATAIQAVNDMVAVGCASFLLNQGVRIPQEMSITGFGNTLLSEHFRVPLTTARQPKHRLGVAAVECMIQLLNKQKPESRRLPADISIRASSGIAPATPVLGRLKMNAEMTL